MVYFNIIRKHCGMHYLMTENFFKVRTEQYKLIHFYEDNVWELYDLAADKNELNNIYGKPGTEAVTADLKAKLVKLQEQYGEQEFIAK